MTMMSKRVKGEGALPTSLLVETDRITLFNVFSPSISLYLYLSLTHTSSLSVYNAFICFSRHFLYTKHVLGVTVTRR